MATGVAFIPPDHEEFRALAIKFNGNAKAIAKQLNIIPHTLYSYFRRDPRAKEILDEVRGYNTFTDLDLAEYVNRINMTKVDENPGIAQRAAEFTLDRKGRERGWIKEDNKTESVNDDNIESTLSYAKENARLREKLQEVLSKYEPETRIEHLSGEQET